MSVKEFLLLVVLVTLCSRAAGDKCPKNWTKKGNKCYLFGGEKVDYATAIKLCQAAGGYLAMPKTQEEINHLKKRDSENGVWIGLDDIKTEGSFVWNDGTSLADGKQSPFWLAGEPTNDGGKGDCVDIWKQNKLNDVQCNTKLSKVCEREPTAQCPKNWTKKGNKCYMFGGEKVDYATARQLCKAAGGYLAMPKSQEEINHLKKKNSENGVWIGLDDIKTEGSFVWNDGSSLADGKQSPFWLAGEPNNDGGKGDCVDIWKQNKLNDVQCNTKLSKVCERDLITTTKEPTVKPTESTLTFPVTMLRRVNGKVNFDRKWASYEKGFGDCQKGDCWLGLKSLYKLCMKGCKLQVTMAYEGKTYHADYAQFMIGPNSDNYRMTIGGYSGDAGDSLAISSGMQFSTKHKLNDKWGNNCAMTFTGGWWYRACHHAHPTGTWGSKEMGKGIVWKTITTQGNSLSSITMKITPSGLS